MAGLSGNNILVNSRCDRRLCRGIWFCNLGLSDTCGPTRATRLSMSKSWGTSKMQTEQIDRSRRNFLRRGPTTGALPMRPPWTDDIIIADKCTRCGKCAAACPEQIITHADGGFPTIDFSVGSGACTFCGACAEACADGVFDRARNPAWAMKATITDASCLAQAGVHCECCRDICDTSAIKFRPRLGAPPAPSLTLDACTGCGACIAVCPKGAIAVSPIQQTEIAA